MTSKACSKCGETKAVDGGFYKDKSRKSGLYPHCKDCVRAKTKKWAQDNPERVAAYRANYIEVNREKVAEYKRAHYKANRDEILSRQREYRDANRAQIAERERERRSRPEARAKQAEYMRRWASENREYVSDYRAKYYAANKAALSERAAAYRLANPHLKWESYYRERAEQYGFSHLIPSMQSFTREDLIWLHGDRCYHCGGDWDQLDHWPLAVSQGGMHALFNAVPSCADCNQRSWRTAPTNNTTITEDRN